MGRYIELNHPLEDGMPAYPGLPSPVIGPLLDHAASRSRYQGKAEFYLGRFEFAGNTGTYLDSPFHRYPDGADLSQIPLEAVAGLPGLVLDARPGPGRGVTIDGDSAGWHERALLIRTGWDSRWRSERYWEPGPFLSPQSLDRLVAAQPALVGVDFWNVDDTTDLSRPAHTRLLAAGILVVEHLANLGALPADGFRFFAVPLRIVRGASFPVRAFAELES